MDSPIQPLRVAHLISGDLWAGAEVASFHLLVALAQRSDVEVRLVSLNPGELVDRIRSADIKVTVVPENDRTFWSLAREVRLQLTDVDLIHAHGYKENLLASLSGRPWLCTQHGRPEPHRGAAALRMGVYAALDGFAQRWSARRVIAVSQEVAEWVARRAGAQRTVLCWNGIADPAHRLRPVPWAERPVRVGTLGRLSPVKGLELAVDAVAGCPGLELEIVGAGPELQLLANRIAAREAGDRIHLMGHIADPLPRVAGWRALLVTSLHEGNPIGVMEALALGTPVVSTPLRGVAEILDGKGGQLESGRDPTEWASDLRGLLGDRDRGRALSQAARERYREAFSATAVADRMVGIYDDAMTR
jgi:glycosyltransferase involved in cell wall biosynthesis